MQPVLVAVLTFGPPFVANLVGLGLDAYSRRAAALAAVAAGLLASGAFALWASMGVRADAAFSVIRVGGPFSAVPGAIFVLCGLVLAAFGPKFSARAGGGAAAALVGVAALGSALAAASFDLVTLLIALEIVGAAGYALVADAGTPRADEAAMKYFVQGAVATGLFVFGLSVLVAGFSGGGSYNRLHDAMMAPAALSAAVAGCLLVLLALAFKSSIVPLHSWAPDAYETAREEVSAVLASGPKLAALSAMSLLLVVTADGDLSSKLVIVMAGLAVLSVLIGSLGALTQPSYTRMLAYAGVAQAGYALIGAVTLNPAAAVFFATTYAVGTAGAFAAAAVFRSARPDWDGTILGLRGLGRSMPLVAGSLALLLVSLAGIPPLLGFWGKLQVFGSALTSAGKAFGSSGGALLGYTYAIAAAAGILGSVISLAYYGSVLRALYLDAEEAGEDDIADSSATGWWLPVVLALVVVVLGLVPLVAGPSAVVLPFTVH